jgi:hypothetical protein
MINSDAPRVGWWELLIQMERPGREFQKITKTYLLPVTTVLWPSLI